MSNRIRTCTHIHTHTHTHACMHAHVHLHTQMGKELMGLDADLAWMTTHGVHTKELPFDHSSPLVKVQTIVVIQLVRNLLADNCEQGELKKKGGR